MRTINHALSLYRGNLLTSVLIVAAALVLAGCSTQPKPVRDSSPSPYITQALLASSDTPAAGVPAQALHTFYLLSHGWHTGVALKSEDVFLYLPQLRQRFPARQWLEFGWGDSGFYQAQTITISIAFKALFVPTTAVVHVVGFDLAPPDYFPHSDSMRQQVNTAHYQDLLAFIAQSFQVDQEGQLERQSQGIYGDAQFYTGVGNYSVISTCNKWTAKALYSAGMDVPVALSLTASSVMHSAAAWQKNPAIDEGPY